VSALYPVPADEEAIDIAGLATLLHVSKDTAYALAQTKAVPAFKVGRVWRFFPSQVLAKLAEPVDAWARSSHSKARRRAG
jgi:excisionase family DNA binding protein